MSIASCEKCPHKNKCLNDIHYDCKREEELIEEEESEKERWGRYGMGN